MFLCDYKIMAKYNPKHKIKTMNLMTYLEKNNIITRETLKIFIITLLSYALFWAFFVSKQYQYALSILLFVSGCLANLYVLTDNNFSMPILAKSKSEFRKLKKQNSGRRICMLNSRTKLRWLADRILIPGVRKIYSLGDILIFIGIISFIF